MNSNDGFLTVKQVTAILQVHYNTVYRWLKEGTLKGAFISGTWRIKRSDIDDLFENKTE